MSRVLPEDVVSAYQSTGLIPIRLAWSTTDSRGGCAMEALAMARGVTLDSLRGDLPHRYEDGFLMAWDADCPDDRATFDLVRAEVAVVKRGFCDGLLCRRAVETAFSSGLIPINKDS